jgi:hypothetical protein
MSAVQSDLWDVGVQILNHHFYRRLDRRRAPCYAALAAAQLGEQSVLVVVRTDPEPSHAVDVTHTEPAAATALLAPLL